MKLETILRKTQDELKVSLAFELKRLGYKPVVRHGFIYAKGDIPIMLVAHLDTVHRKPVSTLCYSSSGDIIMSPEGVGGDDRAGVYMILQLLEHHHCHVLFCEDEECGGIGATFFTHSGIKPDVNFLIELDRRGEKDAVFYDCENPEFTDYICGFGFEEAFGTFSDISILAPHLEVAAVNISAGYYEEHTQHEYIDLRHVRRNIDLVSQILDTPSTRYEYIPASYHSERISFLPPWAYLQDEEGQLMEAPDCVGVNDSGEVFEIAEDWGAFPLRGFSAYTKDGMPAKFNPRSAMWLDVLD